MLTPSPISASISVLWGPTVASRPIRVDPRSWVHGSITVSSPIVTATSMLVVAGATIVTPASM